MPKEQVVFVIDDDNAVRHSICMLLESYGIALALMPQVRPSWRTRLLRPAVCSSMWTCRE